MFVSFLTHELVVVAFACAEVWDLGGDTYLLITVLGETPEVRSEMGAGVIAAWVAIYSVTVPVFLLSIWLKVCVRACVRARVHVCVRARVRSGSSMHVCMCTSVHVCVCACAHVYACMCLCML